MNLDRTLEVINHHMESVPDADLSSESGKFLSRLRELHRELAGNSPIQFTIFGEFNAGKSTLVNAILGAKVSPTSILPATAVNLYIEYEKVPSAFVVRRQSGGDLVEEGIDVHAISDFAKLQLLSNEMVPPEDVEAIKIEWPVTMLKNNGRIVDTPGLADTKERSQIALSEISKTDIAICVLNFDKILNEDEIKFIENLSTQVNGNLVFVINVRGTPSNSQIDKVTEYAKLQLNQIQSHLWEDPIIFLINVELAFEERLAKKHGKNVKMLKALERWISNVLDSDLAPKIRLTSRMANIQQYLEKFEKALKQDIDQQNKYIKQVEKELRDDHREDVRYYRNGINEVIDSLEDVKREEIGEFIDSFVHEYRNNAETEIRNNYYWYEPVREALDLAYNTFSSEFRQRIQDVIEELPYLRGEIDISDHRITWRYKNATYFEGNIGEKIGNFFSGDSEDDFAIARVREDAKGRRSDLKKQATGLIDEAIRKINNFERKNRPDVRDYLDNSRFREAKKDHQGYTQFLKWCTGFRAKLK